MEKYIEKTQSGAYVFKNATVLGDVKLGEGTSVWAGAVLRGDCGSIEVGKGTNIQDNAVLHMIHGENLKIGDNVSIGHNAVIHCREIGDNVLVGMGSVILNRSVVGNNVIIGANATVTEGTVINDGEMWLGSPAKFKRMLSEEEIEGIKNNALEYRESAIEHMEGKYVRYR